MKNAKILIALLGSTLMLTACSKVNKENYDKLSVGMEFTEVTSTIGAPDDCSETLGTKSCVWGDDAKNIKVTFIADKATVFSNKGI